MGTCVCTWWDDPDGFRNSESIQESCDLNSMIKIGYGVEFFLQLQASDKEARCHPLTFWKDIASLLLHRSSGSLHLWCQSLTHMSALIRAHVHMYTHCWCHYCGSMEFNTHMLAGKMLIWWYLHAYLWDTVHHSLRMMSYVQSRRAWTVAQS